MAIFNHIEELVGNTPIVKLNKFGKTRGAQANVYAKVEFFNPGGSVKDRAALAMIEAAERDGLLSQGGTIIEPTSGNTGVGLALYGTLHGYKVILTMPETMSIERRKLAAAYGAEIVLTSGSEGMKGAIAKAEQLRDKTEGAVILQQFENPANPEVHARTTGPEIVRDFEQAGLKVDVLVAGVGTGGTLSGVARVLKATWPDVHVVAVEPQESAVLSGQPSGPHKIQGIGAGFVPRNYDATLVDEVLPVRSEDALAAARALAVEEGLLVGISSGAAAHAATVLAQRPELKGRNIVAVLPDTGERYLSTVLFHDPA